MLQAALRCTVVAAFASFLLQSLVIELAFDFARMQLIVITVGFG